MPSVCRRLSSLPLPFLSFQQHYLERKHCGLFKGHCLHSISFLPAHKAKIMTGTKEATSVHTLFWKQGLKPEPCHTQTSLKPSMWSWLALNSQQTIILECWIESMSTVPSKMPLLRERRWKKERAKGPNEGGPTGRDSAGCLWSLLWESMRCMSKFV